MVLKYKPTTMTRTQKGRVRRLITALRSGKYIKTVGTLKSTEPDGNISYCCLGVACDLFSKATKKGNWDEEGVFNISGQEGHSSVLPKTVMRWYGFSSDDPKVDLGNTVVKLGKMRTPITGIVSATEVNDETEPDSFTIVAKSFERMYLKTKKK